MLHLLLIDFYKLSKITKIFYLTGLYSSNKCISCAILIHLALEYKPESSSNSNRNPFIQLQI